MLNKPKKFFVANWKMNLDRLAVERLTEKLKKQLVVFPQTETVICPSFIDIPYVFQQLHKLNVKVGAQDAAWQNTGSLTGEVSPLSLKQYGVEYVIIGHSERRQLLQETDEMIESKLNACFKNGLQPILCVGETFEERQSGRQEAVIVRQIRKALSGVVVGPRQRIMVAYEPVWVIGSGQAVDPDEAQHIVKVIREEVFDIYKDHEYEVDDYLSILYGGSVDSENINDFIKGNISGVLVGGASLDADEFNKMLKIINK